MFYKTNNFFSKKKNRKLNIWLCLLMKLRKNQSVLFKQLLWQNLKLKLKYWRLPMPKLKLRLLKILKMMKKMKLPTKRRNLWTKSKKRQLRKLHKRKQPWLKKNQKISMKMKKKQPKLLLTMQTMLNWKQTRKRCLMESKLT